TPASSAVMRPVLPALAALLVLSPARGDAPAKHPITPLDLWKVARVGPPSMAPDGAGCVVEFTRDDVDKDEGKSDWWILSTDGKTQKQLTSAGGKSSGPKWSPDGRSIAFVAKRDGDDQPHVYVIST